MDIISQNAQHRQRMLKYLENHHITKTALRFKVSRKTVYKWKHRYDGSLESLKDRSHKPHNSPKAHNEAEIKLLRRCLKKYRWTDLIAAFQLLLTKGYKRSYGGFKRFVQKLRELKPKKKKLKKKAQLYKRAEYPGQKIQIDVKFVPSKCVVNGGKFYQYTAKDECTRWTFRLMYDEHSTYSSKDFLDKMLDAFPFPVREVQTDNGTEFTNTLLVVKSKHKTLFEAALNEMDIIYHRIRIATPRHNGKVERQHRTDQMRFYNQLKIFSLEDGQKQLAVYQAKSNNYIMTCLNMRSPNQLISDYIDIM